MLPFEQKLRAKFPNHPESFFRRQLADVKQSMAEAGMEQLPKPAKRIRQSSKPILNKLEQQWFDRLKADGAVTSLSAQALRFKLANGAWYKCDMVGWIAGKLHGWEVKGPSCMKNVDRGILTIKVAAAAWPEVAFYLVWQDSGLFKQQQVLA